MEYRQRNILFITGTRADFGKLKPLAQECINKSHNVTFFVTGMHMMTRYGETRLEVHNFPGCDKYEFINHRDSDSQDIILSKTVLGLSDYLNEKKFDLIIIHGDRVEALAASIVCALNNLRSVHIEGGEVSGTIDEALRHCNTKLCTHHFVSSEDAKKRILRLGEEANRVNVIGSPEIDIHLSSTSLSIEEVKNYYDISFADYGILLYHPVTTDLDNLKSEIDNLVDAVIESKKNYVVILPNNDPGCEIILKIYEQKLRSSKYKIIPSMRFEYFSVLMKNAKILIGNSSAGVREAPVLSLPSIDVGSRQNDRAQTDSILSSQGDSVEDLTIKIQKHWSKNILVDMSYGDGSSAKKFLKAIESNNFWDVPLQKIFK